MATDLELIGLILAVIEFVGGAILLVYKILTRRRIMNLKNKQQEKKSKKGCVQLNNLFGSELEVTIKSLTPNWNYEQHKNTAPYIFNLNSYIFNLCSMFKVDSIWYDAKVLLEIKVHSRYLAYETSYGKLIKNKLKVTLIGLEKDNLSSDLLKQWSFDSAVVWKENETKMYFFKISDDKWLIRLDNNETKLKVDSTGNDSITLMNGQVTYVLTDNQLKMINSDNSIQIKSGSWQANNQIKTVDSFQNKKWIKYGYEDITFIRNDTKWIQMNNEKTISTYLEIEAIQIGNEIQVILFNPQYKQFMKMSSNSLSEGRISDFLEKCGEGSWTNDKKAWQGTKNQESIIIEYDSKTWFLNSTVEYIELNKIDLSSDVYLFDPVGKDLIKLTLNEIFIGKIVNNISFFNSQHLCSGSWSTEHSSSIAHLLKVKFQAEFNEINEVRAFSSPTKVPLLDESLNE